MKTAKRREADELYREWKRFVLRGDHFNAVRTRRKFERARRAWKKEGREASK